jgi:hypothetical protein
VPADNHVERSCNRIEIQLRNIVKYVYQGRTCLGDCRRLPLLANDLLKHVTCDFADFAQILRLLGMLYENG